MDTAGIMFGEFVRGGLLMIDKCFGQPISENCCLDYKTSADGGNGTQLHRDDRANLSHAISGFGNAMGGIIIWGIRASRGSDGADVPQERCPINNPNCFLGWLEEAIPRCTVLPHVNVRNHVILERDGQSGYVVTYIPQSIHMPLRIADGIKEAGLYKVRSGSSFITMPHEMLAALFGRPPQPALDCRIVPREPHMIRVVEDECE